MNDTERPTWCDINLAALEHNYKAVQAHVGNSQVMPIVKADAYGHGLIQVAQKLQDLNTSCLGVAYVEEGIALRQGGITTCLLYTSPSPRDRQKSRMPSSA